MLSLQKLATKRRQKEIKRKAKRRSLFLQTVKELKGRKHRKIVEQAMRAIRTNPSLLQNYINYQSKLMENKVQNNVPVKKPGSVD